MQWYEGLLDELDTSHTYSHKELIAMLKRKKPDLSESTYHWSVSSLVRDGKLFRQGYDSYILSDGNKLTEYLPEYSDMAKKLISIVSKRFPYVKFTVFETVLMNDFLNHLVAQLSGKWMITIRFWMCMIVCPALRSDYTLIAWFSMERYPFAIITK